MNEASRRRLALAKEIAPAYALDRSVAAVMVGGSVSRGWADAYSDLEIGVFWQRPPSEAQRVAAFERAGATDRREYPYDAALEDWEEEYTLRGVKIDIVNRTVESTERRLADVLQRYHTQPPGQALLAAIRHGVPLGGAALLERWQTRLAAYPDELARRVVSENLAFGPHAWLEMLAQRGSLLALYEILCAAERLLLAALMGLHRVYNPGYKWAERAAAELPLAPPDLAARLSNVFRAEPEAGVAEIRRLIEDTFALVEKHMPEVDTSGPRARFERSRGPASGLPW